MLLKERLIEYYIDKDYNCAESTLRAMNDHYNLGIEEEDFKLASGFGKGMGCESTCGSLAAGIGAAGKLLVQQRAHATPGFGDACAAFVQCFRKRLGTENCHDLREKFFNPEQRCLVTIEQGADTFEVWWEEMKTKV